MDRRVVQTNTKLAAARQIHAAIFHFYAGEYECAITLCSAAEGRIPEPKNAGHLLSVLQQGAKEFPPLEGGKDDFNYAANWLKHAIGAESVEIESSEVLLWLNRAISKFRASYEAVTPEMARFFPWSADRH